MTLNEWKNKCKAEQENFSNLLGDRYWDRFALPQDKVYLFQKIAIALYGPPKDPKRDDFGLSDDQKKVVDNIKDKCIEHSKYSDAVYLGIIFVHVYMVKDKQELLVPVVRIRDTEFVDKPWKNRFIDHLGRVYYNWTKYKEDNTWDMCWLCAPGDGYYRPEQRFEFLDQSDRGELLQTADAVSTVTAATTSAYMIAGTVMTFFPLTAPLGIATVAVSSIIGAPAAAYGVGRSVAKLGDRLKHEQSISLADAEARQCWLVTTAGLLSAGTLASATLLENSARAGNLVSSTTRAICTAINVSSVSLQGLSVLILVHDLAKKDEISGADVFQLTTSIFFFTHSLVSFQTASDIIKQAQREEIASMRNGLNKGEKQVYDAMLKGNQEVIEKGKVREMHGNAKFIREMHKIGNVQEFFSHFQIKQNSQFHINNELTIHPRAFVQLTETDRATLLDMSKQLSENKITVKQFQQTPIMQKYRFRLDKHRQAAQDYVKRTFNVDNVNNIKIGNIKLGDLQPHQVDRLEGVVRNSFDNGDPKLMQLAEAFANEHGASCVTEYCAAGEYCVRKIKAEVSRRRAENPNPTRPKGTKVKDFYTEQVVREFLQNPSKLKNLSREFSDLRARCDAANVGNPRLHNSMAAANHYDKHPDFPAIDPDSNISPELYFEIATEMANGKPSDVIWSQDGNSIKCTFHSDKYGATCITYELVADGKVLIATLMATNVKKSRAYSVG